MRTVFSLIFIVVLVAYITGCQSSDQEGVTVMPGDLTSDLKTLADARVFFGHQSVGKNIIQGLELLAEDAQGIDLNIADYETYKADGNGCLLHTRVGLNEDPVSKCIDFGRIIEEELADKIDYAVLKYCYLDVNRESDVSKVFDDYRRTMDDLMSRHPNITFIHTTVPLMSSPSGWKVWIKELLGKTSTRKLDNVKRNEFNGLLKETYGDSSIIDIAKSESTYPDGSREVFKMNGQTYYTLIKEYTYDGGHLNDDGKIQVASAFVRDLAQIIRDRSSDVK
jgi:hypothetical protein